MRRSGLRVLGLLVGLGLTAACSGGVTSSPTPQQSPAEALTAAIDLATEANTGSFRASIGFYRAATVTDEGQYRLSPASAVMNREVTRGYAMSQAHAVSTQDRSWIQFTTSEESLGRCWVEVDLEMVDLTSFLDGMAPGVPDPVRALLEAEAVEYVDGADDRLIANANLATVASGLAGIVDLTVPPDTDATVPIEVFVDANSSRVAWNVSLLEIFDAAEEEGLDIPSNVPGRKEPLDRFIYTVTIDVTGDEVEILPPPADLVIEIAPSDPIPQLEKCGT